MNDFPTWTAGVVGHGVSAPSRDRKRPDLCAGYGHPGCTYNPFQDSTWCLCGSRVYAGNQATHAACCGGPLADYRNDEDRAYWDPVSA